MGDDTTTDSVAIRGMNECFQGCMQSATVSELANRHVIFVEDGNHGENRPRQDEFASAGIAFIRPPDLKEGRVDFECCGRINEAGFKRVRKGIGRQGDIILTHRATVGRIAITDDSAPEVFVTNPGTTIWRSTNPNVLDQRYLYCFMRSRAFMDQLWSQVGNNCTFDYVSLTQQRGLVIAFPSLSEQRAIAHILGTLDDKIELNRRRNRTLEAVAPAIFQSWFVDFDPVHAKAAGRSPPGLSPEIAALFPSEFEDSELGPVPKGWRAESLSQLAEINYGKNLPGTQLLGHGVSVYGAAGVVGYFRETMFHTPVVLITSRGSGSGTVHETTGPAFVTNNSFSIVPRESTFSRHYLRFSLQISDIAARVTGSAQPQLTITNLQSLALLKPTTEISKCFHRLADGAWEMANSNTKESRTLAALRDALLPKLISGELRVPDAERIVGRAV